jgi:hypothetical protein
MFLIACGSSVSSPAWSSWTRQPVAPRGHTVLQMRDWCGRRAPDPGGLRARVFRCGHDVEHPRRRRPAERRRSRRIVSRRQSTWFWAREFGGLLLSTDGGATGQHLVGRSYAYPSMCRAPDGTRYLPAQFNIRMSTDGVTWDLLEGSPDSTTLVGTTRSSPPRATATIATHLQTTCTPGPSSRDLRSPRSTDSSPIVGWSIDEPTSCGRSVFAQPKRSSQDLRHD